MKLKYTFIIFFSVLLVVSCKQKTITEKAKQVETVNEHPKSLAHKIVILEVVDGGSYSYLKVEENTKTYWMAVSKIDAKVGETYYYDRGMTMRNFESKQLKKVFDEIVFADAIRKTEKSEVKQHSHSETKKASEIGEVNIKLAKTGNDIYLKDLFENKAKYAGKEVEVSGVVVKVNKMILDRNWIHIVDGTKTADASSLTVTSKNLVKIGDTVTAKGIIVLNKDFGYGYVYDILLEDAKF